MMLMDVRIQLRMMMMIRTQFLIPSIYAPTHHSVKPSM